MTTRQGSVAGGGGSCTPYSAICSTTASPDNPPLPPPPTCCWCCCWWCLYSLWWSRSQSACCGAIDGLLTGASILSVSAFLCLSLTVLLPGCWGGECCRPSDQPRDAARREECLDLDEKSLTTFMLLWEGKKDLLESIKMDFMRIKMNYSKRCSRWRFPERVSIDPVGSRCVGLSDTKHICRNVQSCIRTCSPAIWR